MIPRLLEDLFRTTRALLLQPLLSPILRAEILRWHRSRLYWEGVAHPNGGDQEDGANIELAEGGMLAVRRLADLLGLAPASLPHDEEARRLGRTTLELELDAEESASVNTLARLGPSARIPVTGRMADHIAASEAEETLEHAERIREYLAWLAEIDRAADSPQSPGHDARNGERRTHRTPGTGGKA